MTSSERENLRERAREAIRRQANRTVTVLSSLLAVEDALGWIPEEAVEEVAEFTGSTINDVWAVASFYTNFRFSPPNQHVVEVCWGPSCHLVGAQELARMSLDVLGLPGEGDSEDGKVTFKFNTCLGACAKAPVVSVDHRLLGQVSPERLKEVLGDVRRDSSGSGG